MEQFFQQNLWILILIIFLIIFWTIPWKGWALWKSARLNDKGWFIALLVFNTLGMLEIFYLFVISKKKKSVESTRA